MYNSSQNIDRCCIHQWVTLLKFSLVFAVYPQFRLLYSLSHFTISPSTSHYVFIFFFPSHSISRWTWSARHNWLWWQWAVLNYVIYVCVCVGMHVETICLLFRLSGLIADYDLFVQFIYETPKNVWHHEAHCVVLRTINKLHACFHQIFCVCVERVSCQPIVATYIFIWHYAYQIHSFTFHLVADCVRNCLIQTDQLNAIF